jgi:hypothetical protein
MVCTSQSGVALTKLSEFERASSTKHANREPMSVARSIAIELEIRAVAVG